MMEVAKGSGIELLNREQDQGEVRDRDAPVYFDRKHDIISSDTGWILIVHIARQCSNPLFLCSQSSIC